MIGSWQDRRQVRQDAPRVECGKVGGLPICADVLGCHEDGGTVQNSSGAEPDDVSSAVSESRHPSLLASIRYQPHWMYGDCPVGSSTLQSCKPSYCQIWCTQACMVDQATSRRCSCCPSWFAGSPSMKTVPASGSAIRLGALMRRHERSASFTSLNVNPRKLALETHPSRSTQLVDRAESRSACRRRFSLRPEKCNGQRNFLAQLTNNITRQVYIGLRVSPPRT